MATTQLSIERIRIAAETYQHVSQQIDALGQVDDELVEQSKTLSQLTDAVKARMALRKDLTQLTAEECRAMGGANSEAVFWIQKRAQERDAKINDIVDKLNKQIEKTFTAKQELLNKKEQLELYEAQLTELFASVFGPNPDQNPAEQEMNSLKSELNLLEESLPNYDEALHHLHTAREDVIFAITCLQRYDEPNADAELLSTTRIHPRRSVTSPTLTPSSASVQKDKDMVEMTLTDFHDILSYTARAQEHVEQARSLVPELPGLTSDIKISDHELLLDTDSSKESGIPLRKLYFSRAKITATLLALVRVSTVLNDLNTFAQAKLRDANQRRDVLAAKYKVKKDEVLRHRCQAFEELITQEGSSAAVQDTPRYEAELIVVENKAIVVPVRVKK